MKLLDNFAKLHTEVKSCIYKALAAFTGVIVIVLCYFALGPSFPARPVVLIPTVYFGLLTLMHVLRAYEKSSEKRLENGIATNKLKE